MKAYELIEQLDWCQGDYARNIDGADVAPTNPNAVCFCTLGAIQRCYGTGLEFDVKCTIVESSIMKIERYLFLQGPAVIVRWNDTKHRKKEEVIALLRELDV